MAKAKTPKSETKAAERSELKNLSKKMGAKKGKAAFLGREQREMGKSARGVKK